MTFNAITSYGKTSSQNKALRIRQLRADRGTRAQVATIPDLKRDDWPSDRPATITYRDTACAPGPNVQWAWNVHKGDLVRRTTELVWDNIGVTGEHRHLKWGSREYNVGPRLITHCDYTDIAQEHGAYISNSSDTTVIASTFLRCGSQGLQFAHRPKAYQQYTADNMPYERSPIHTIDDCHFVDCGYKGTRPSFSLTYFDPGSTEHPGKVKVRDSSFVAAWPEAAYKDNFSTGAFVLTPSQGGPDIVPEMGDMLQHTIFENCVFDYTSGDRPIGVIRGSTNILFERCCLIAREHKQPWIDIDSGGFERLGGMKSKRIAIRDCVAKGVKMRVFGPDNKVIATVDMNCPGGEIMVNGMTGEVRRLA